MNAIKCHLKSGAMGSQTGLLITFSEPNEYGSLHLVITPAPLSSYFGVNPGNPRELSVESDSTHFFEFTLANKGPASASGGGAGGVYSHWISFSGRAPI